MASSDDNLRYQVRLIRVPEKLKPLLPEDAGYVRELRFIEINGRTPALNGIIDYLRKDKSDVKKLVKNAILQLKSRTILKNKLKVQPGRGPGHENILEINATRGHSRLFAFLSPDDTLIICTHTYWKTDDKGKQQDREFSRAATVRDIYLDSLKKGIVENEE